MTLTTTSSTVAAGNIVGAAAAASTQFALLNPLGSGKNLVLIKFGLGIISGTPAGGPVYHGILPNVQNITAATPGGTVLSNYGGVGTGSVVTKPWALAAGSALTGGQAPVTLCLADFAVTATAQAIANGYVRAIEELAGAIIIPPGYGWLPLHAGAGTSHLNGYSITWEEVPV